MKRLTVEVERRGASQTYELSDHARRRMYGCGFSLDAVRLALEYGRSVYTRGARVFAVGWRECRRWAKKGLDLQDVEGMQVIVSADEPTVITMYRNHEFAFRT